MALFPFYASRFEPTMETLVEYETLSKSDTSKADINWLSKILVASSKQD